MDIMQLQSLIIPYGLRVVQALAIWFIGGFLISIFARIIVKALNAKSMDSTLVRYIDSIIRGGLKVFLIIAILDVFGVQTTSLAALIAAAGVAIGAAWAGLLSNFAAGFFLIILRPYKVGDTISVAGTSGEVVEIGLFVTTLHTVDNVKIFVGNAKVFGDVIMNYSTNPHRRVDLKCQLANGVNPITAMDKIKNKISKLSNVNSQPGVEVQILEFNSSGTLLTIRAYCQNKDYWQVFFDGNKAIAELSAQENYPVPAPHSIVYNKN